MDNYPKQNTKLFVSYTWQELPLPSGRWLLDRNKLSVAEKQNSERAFLYAISGLFATVDRSFQILFSSVLPFLFGLFGSVQTAVSLSWKEDSPVTAWSAVQF